MWILSPLLVALPGAFQQISELVSEHQPQISILEYALMERWKKEIFRILVKVEERVDLFKYRLRERVGGRDAIMILPYLGYGTADNLYLKGRVLEDRGITSAEAHHSIWDNLINTYKRFGSNEIPYAKLAARFQNVDQQVIADEEGFFEVWIHPTKPLPEDRIWHQIELDLLEPQRVGYPPVRTQGKVLVPPPSAQFGVISDIDDTVLYTETANWLRMAGNIFLSNARTRLPFRGVSEFYQRLRRGSHGNQNNPIFYVSSSPWNIYDLLSDFFQLQEIPYGPMLFLRDWGLNEDELLPTNHRLHKLRTIRNLLDVFKELSFILIGDSGQEDPEIYVEVVKEYPGRILGVYIRDVSKDVERVQAIEQMAREVAAVGCSLILAEETSQMAQHAVSQQWISPEASLEIPADKVA